MRPSSLLLSGRRLGLLGVVLGLATMSALVRSDEPPDTDGPPSSAPLRPARNPVRLHLSPESAYVFGWISGARDQAGQTVLVTAAGKTDKVPVLRGNVFTWPYRVEKATPVHFICGRLHKTLTLRPPTRTPPCAFFVVDRGVYRPKQTLRFAAFLRDLDAGGEFVPRPAQTVEVVLTSETKKTTAARLQLTSDAQGRINGEHTFGDADPLDSYRLSIPSYRGAAQVRLAEYRKSKTRLNVLSRREGSRLELRFQARDYLDKPIQNARVHLVAQVIHSPVHPPAATLDGKQFAYADDDPPPVLRLEDLTTEERLLAEADGGSELLGGLNVGRERQVVKQIEGKIALDGRGEGLYPIELHRGWMESGHEVVVRGVMIDGDGREERRTKTIPLSESDDSLRLSLPRSTFLVNEPIRVTAHTTEAAGLRGSLTLVASRLSAAPPAGPPAGAPAGSVPGLPPIVMADWSSIRRSLATAAAFRGDTSLLRLTEPGAYVLTAIWQRPDGTRRRQEVGCVVRSVDDAPALRLRLDRDTYQSGDTLTASVRSGYADACVLLTVRDAVGLRLWKTFRLSKGRADVKLVLPADLHYGCSVEVLYADGAADAEPAHVCSRLVHVVPARRMLTIESEVKPVCEPGEKVTLGVRVNRKEPVDLIVSVYDKALLKIAPDQAVDVRDFFLADDRIYRTHAREVLRRQLGETSLDLLFLLARASLAANPDKQATGAAAALRSLLLSAEDRQLRTPDVATLLRLAGIKTRALDALHTWPLPPTNAARRTTVWDWLNTPGKDGWRLHYALINDTLFLSAYHPTQNPHPWKTKAAIYYPYVANNGMGGMAGLGGGLGGLGGIGGIAGLGGQGFQNLGQQGGFQGQGNLGMGGIVGGGIGGANGRPLFVAQAPERPNPGGPALLDSDDFAPDLQIRRNFADSAHWDARLRTDADGKARVEFKVPDSLTSWQVVVTAISKDMHVGHHETSFRTARPLMVNPILPRFFTEGDTVRVSANVRNQTDARQTVRVRLKTDNGRVREPAEQNVAIEAGGSASVAWNFQAGDAGVAEILMSAESQGGSDASLKRLAIVRAGVEHVVTASGFCKDTATINLPDGVDLKQVVFEVRFVPSLTADLLDTLPYLVDYPYGCVEQTMSRFLPAIKVAQILKQMRLDSPELNAKLPGCVSAGIKRLLHLQHADGGWGWWENDATHEFMTPYALYGLLEAEKAGYSLGSEDAIKRGLARLEQFIEKMGARESADRIFCMYVYGQRLDLPPKWWAFIENRRADGTLSDYALALALELAVLRKKVELQDRLAADLRGRARKGNGQVFWRTGGFSRWADDRFEVTAAALKALVAVNKDDPLIPGVLAYFAATKRDNRWNSTKDTALIVCAVCDYLARLEIDPRGRPRVAFRCNDGPEEQVPFAAPSESRLVVVPAERVRAGVNRLTFAEGTAGMMYRATLRYWVSGRRLPAESNGIEVARRWWLLDDKGRRGRELKSGDEVPRGAYLESTVEARSLDRDAPMRYVLVENPRPAGCEVLPADDARFDQRGTVCLLREDREKLVAFHHDRMMGAIEDRCVLHAELPGEYLVPPAHVELMYQTAVRGHSGTFAFRVADR